MPTIAFDETHAETWSIDPDTARELNSTTPKYHYLGHVRDILSDIDDIVFERITEQWTEETFRDVDVLIIADPSDSEEYNGVDGESYFTDDEIEFVDEFVEKGGGLFIMGEHGNRGEKTNINNLLAQYGIMLKENKIRVPKSSEENHILRDDFYCSEVNDHNITSGVDQISINQSCSIKCNQDNIEKLINSPGGETVCAATEHGEGRVTVVGDSDLFAIPYIGQVQNAVLFRNVIEWLVKGTTVKQEERQSISKLLRNTTVEINSYENKKDLKKVDGPHVLDCSDYEEELKEISNIDLNPYKQQEEFIKQARLKFHELPQEIRKQLIEYRQQGNEYGVLLVTNLPTDPELPETPEDAGRVEDKGPYKSEFWNALFGAAVGEVFGYKQEKEGEIFQNICPTPENEKKLSSESSKILLDFHTETAFHPVLQDFILLNCLRSDHEKEAKTFFASVEHILPQIPLEYRAVLFNDVYRTGIDYSFGSESGEQGNGPVTSILYGDRYDPYFKFDLDLMVGLNDKAKQSLEEVKKAANEAKNYVRLEEGDLAIIDNRRAIHGRSSFTPRYDGKDRWLQRTFVSRDLTLSNDINRSGERVVNVKPQNDRIVGIEFNP